jgi:hypothetical protein
MKKAKTPLLRAWQNAFAIAQKSRLTGKTVDQVIDAEKTNAINRRDFIKQSALASMAVGTSSVFGLPKKKDSSSLRTDIKIGIVL